ncbi:MAG TPA: branched-chain amino acid ABC transporter substrate-binding protein [Solirubrobacteraceae bacterium]|nr:branched-chain amino acid ABC transporter substrate-binding protein [Solirubrobacteraceae bacterium]
MLARRLGLAAVLAALPILSGCAATSTSPDSAEATGGSLTVYSSLPLQGPDGPASKQIVDGEKLALAQAGARAGPYKIGYVSLDDSEPKTGVWNPGITASNAKRAAQDPSTIAYLGDFNSAATAISLPLINGAGVLQVSPSSPYVGLTSSLDAGQDEPGRFYPSGRRTFGRVIPGDPAEAQAQLELMRSLGVHRVYVLDDMDPFASALATIVAGKAQAAGIRVQAHEGISTVRGASFEKLVENVSASGADAVFMAGEGSASTARLWRELHRADPQLNLLADSSMANGPFPAHLGAAAAGTYLTTPLLSTASYPPQARRVLAAYRRAFGTRAGPWALYGYAAMRMVLDAVDSAGRDATDRRTVIARLLGAPPQESVLGPIAIGSDGESTLTRYGVDTISDGTPTFLRAVTLPATAGASG